MLHTLLLLLPVGPAMMTTQDLISRIRAEHLEMPGMRLTIRRVQRLFGIEQTLCTTVLDALVDARFLCVKANGAYAHLTDGEVVRPRPAKADLVAKPRWTKAS